MCALVNACVETGVLCGIVCVCVCVVTCGTLCVTSGIFCTLYVVRHLWIVAYVVFVLRTL